MRLCYFSLAITFLLCADCAFAQDAWHPVTRLKDVGGLDLSANPNVIPGDPKLYATTDEGVWISSDRGETWKIFSQGLRDKQIRRIYKTTHGNWIALLGGPEGIRVSTNNGVSWIHEQSMQLTPVEELIEHHDHTLLVSVKGAVIMRSTDAGMTWMPSNTGLPLDHWGLALKLLANGDILLSGGFNEEHWIYRSTDAGLSWSISNSGLSGVPIRSFAQGFDGVVYAGTMSQGVYRSSDNGQSWQPFNSGLGDETEDIESIAIANDGSLYAGTEGAGIYRSVDHAFWEHTGPGAGAFINYIVVATDGYVYAGSSLDIVRSDLSTGVNSVPVRLDYPLSISPNPASDRVRLHGTERGAMVQVVDILGRVVMSVEMGESNTLDIGSLANGPYTVVEGGGRRAILVKE